MPNDSEIRQRLTGRALRLERSINGGGCLASVLARIDNATYRLTGSEVGFQLVAGAQVAMGSEEDLRPGAVIYAIGRVAGAELRASKVAILTDVVQIVSAE